MECKQLLCIDTKRKGIKKVCFSPDSTKFLSGEHDGRVILRHIDDGSVVWEYKHDNIIRDCCFSYDGRYVVSVSSDEKMFICDSNTGHTISAHDYNAFKCEYQFNNIIFLSSPFGKIIHNVSVNVHDMYCTDFDPVPDSKCTNKYIICGIGYDLMILYPIIASFKVDIPIMSFTARDCGDDCNIVYKSSDKIIMVKITVIDRETDSNLDPIWNVSRKGWGDVYGLEISPDNICTIVWSKDRYIRCLNNENGSIIWRTRISGGSTNTCVFSRDSTKILVASNDCGVRIFDSSNGHELWKAEHNERVYDCCFSPDENIIMSYSADESIRLWFNPFCEWKHDNHK